MTAVGSQNRLSRPFKTLNPFFKRKRDTTTALGSNRRRSPYLTLPGLIFLLSFHLLPFSCCRPCSSLVPLSFSSSILAPFHSQTKIHSSHLVSGVRSCLGTVCIFLLFVFSFYSSFSSLLLVPFYWVLLLAFCSVYFGFVTFVLR